MHQALAAFIGGSLIGLASIINLKLKGRLAGMSRLVYHNFFKDFDAHYFCLLLGMLGVGSLKPLVDSSLGEESVEDLSTVGYVVAGALVGFGGRLGGGCTSGHGVCGLPRFSKRSWAAVCTFLPVAIITANLVYRGEAPSKAPLASQSGINRTVLPLVSLVAVAAAVGYILNKYPQKRNDVIVGLSVGAIFATGLCVAGMTQRSKVLGFLVLSANWDYSLLIVLGSAVGINAVVYPLVLSKPPLMASKHDIPASTPIDAKLIIGSAIFGAGWGLAGICPGPLYVLFPRFVPQISTFAASVVFGQYAFEKINP